MTTGFPWDKTGPSAEALAAFTRVTDDKAEFPYSYSGQAWRAAYRLWLAIKDQSAEEQSKQTKDGFSYRTSWNWGGEKGGEDLGLTGFMAGWAINAVRQMLNLKAIPNPAVLTIGGPQHPLPDTGPADEMMQEAIGGKAKETTN